MKRLVTKIRVSWWLAVAQVCLWLDWPSGALVALSLAKTSMPHRPPHEE